MFGFLAQLFDTRDFNPRWVCGNWTTAHGMLHILSDLGVWSAYVAIPCVLVYFALRRRDVPFRSMFWLFGAFILACGTTHLMEAILFYWPAYRLSGMIKLTTALISWSTVIALIPVIPRALALRSPTDLEQEIAGRKRAEETARNIEENFRQLVMEVQDYAIYLLDLQGRIVSWNIGAERIKGYRPDEIIGQHVARFYPPDAVKEGCPEHELAVAKVEGRFEDEGWRVRKDGSQFWANMILTALKDEAGRVKGFSKITRDLTERKRAEEALQQAHDELEMRVQQRTADLAAANASLQAEVAERTRGKELLARQTEELQEAVQHLQDSEARSRAVLATAVDAIISIDEFGTVESLNPATERLFGYPAAEVVGRNVKLLMPPPYTGEHDAYLQNYLRTGEKKIIGIGREVVGRRKDGTTFPMHLAVSELRLGQRRMFTGIARDITDLKHAIQDLQDSEERTRLILENALDAVVTINQAGAITGWNVQAEAIFGWPRDEALGKSLAGTIIPPQYREAHRYGLDRFLATGEGPVLNTRIEITALHRAGHEFPVELTISPVHGGEGYFFTAFIRDITQRRRAEEATAEKTRELALTNAQLLRSNQELDDFAYIASHDLREPLRGIFNYSSFLIEDYGDKLDVEGREKLHTLQHLCQRLDALIDALLGYSRLGRVDLAIQETDLNELLAGAIDSLRITLKQRDVEIRIPRPLPTVKCDHVRVAEVFRNLISNALKYNDKPHKWIEIGYIDPPAAGTEPAGRSHPLAPAVPVFYVRDNGIGIREQHRDLIFRIFKRLHGRDKFGGGTGAGLTIVKKIIERHHGRIWVESKFGEGTTFYFTLQRGSEK